PTPRRSVYIDNMVAPFRWSDPFGPLPAPSRRAPAAPRCPRVGRANPARRAQRRSVTVRASPARLPAGSMAPAFSDVLTDRTGAGARAAALVSLTFSVVDPAFVSLPLARATTTGRRPLPRCSFFASRAETVSSTVTVQASEQVPLTASPRDRTALKRALR